MRNTEEARLLLTLARQDLDALLVLKDTQAISERIFGFHAQQAVEKGLKAWLSLLGVEYPFTHSLNVLFGLLEDQVGSAMDQFRELEMLTPFAVQLRYTAYEDSENELDRNDVAVRVRALLEHVSTLAARSAR